MREPSRASTEVELKGIDIVIIDQRQQFGLYVRAQENEAILQELA